MSTLLINVESNTLPRLCHINGGIVFYSLFSTPRWEMLMCCTRLTCSRNSPGSGRCLVPNTTTRSLHGLLLLESNRDALEAYSIAQIRASTSHYRLARHDESTSYVRGSRTVTALAPAGSFYVESLVTGLCTLAEDGLR